jgi:hypothetical protein
MLTSESPHSGTNPQAIVAKLLTEAVWPVTVLRPTVPAHVDAALQGAATLPLTSMRAAPGAGWLLGRAPTGGDDASILSVRDPAAAREIPLPADGALSGLALSPDGAQYTARVTDSTGGVLQLRSLTGAPTREVYAGTAGVTQFSPSGRQLASVNVALQSLLVVEVATGTVRTLASGVQLRSLTWIGDTALLMIPTANGPIRRYSTLSGTVETLGSSVRDSVDIRVIAAADNGQLLATARIRSRPMLITLDAEARLLDTLATLPGSGRLQLAADVVVVQVQGRLWGVPLDRTRRRATGAVRALIGAEAGSEVTGIAAAESGALLVLRSAATSERDLLLVDRAARAVPATPFRRAFRAPRFAPSGRAIASLFTTTIVGEAASIDVTCGTVQRVSADSVVLANQWTPDGQRILLALRGTVNNGNIGGRVVSVAADGGGSEQELLRRLNLLYELDEIYLTRLEADGPRWTVSRGGGGEARWGIGGELLYRKGDTVFTAQVTGTETPAISAPKRLMVFPAISAPFEALWDVAPDGQRFAMVVQRGEDRRELLLLLDWQGKWRAEGEGR